MNKYLNNHKMFFIDENNNFIINYNYSSKLTNQLKKKMKKHDSITFGENFNEKI